MKTAMRKAIKEFQEKMDEICPEEKSLCDVHDEWKVRDFYKYQYAQTLLKNMLGEW